MANINDKIMPRERGDDRDNLWVSGVTASLRKFPSEALCGLNLEVLVAHYAGAFPPSFRQAHGPDEAAADISALVRLEIVSGDRMDLKSVRLHRRSDDRKDRLRLRLYQRVDTLILSDVVSVLENFGFRVADCYPHGLQGAKGSIGHIHDFLLGFGQSDDQIAIDQTFAHTQTIEQSLEAVLNGEREDDSFNLLISHIGLDADETNWLRALYRYLRQTGIAYSVSTAVEALVQAPSVTRGLIELFRARHEPDVDRAAGEREALAAIMGGIAGVSSINHDRLIRALKDSVLAILRTNAFVPVPTLALAFKFDSALIPGLTKPIPWREIFVYSGQVEGIHLRAGPIARGGLRWSDRRDDFRTEVLSLMKAQRVKNAIIVPTGAKGGFYPKKLPDPLRNRSGWAAEGHAAYQSFVRALLSVTDNIVDGQVVPPRDVVIRDHEDSYLVVAADKGTASFSDSANAIAHEQGYWLEDAFASGGTKGYDHKAMGITARGAWISVQRHFAERGIDVQSDPINVVGVGDMSGDVFGNGMLLSQAIRLIAAFDHRHIFLDPAPNASVAWHERARLFAQTNSTWADYNQDLISSGGGVFSREQKSIALSPEVRSLLRLEERELEPDMLIRAILLAPADLLWFGGIGTYIKAKNESNRQVGDPTNDIVRIDATDLRVGVIAEGANLGCTQAGRIEASLAGVACNTDFIDNSAGVDCSDKEVNIKIALSAAKRGGRLDEPERVALLASMTDEVAELVLEDNRMQALGLSLAQSLGTKGTSAYLWLAEILEKEGHLDRATEGLPNAELLQSRAANGQGLTRAELAVLLSSAKLAVQSALESSPLMGDPLLEGELLEAFPPSMRDAYRDDILRHRLRREILATRIANRVINRLGFIHPFEIADEDEVSLSEVAIAFLIVEHLFNMAPVWRAIETTQMQEQERISLLVGAASALRPQVVDVLGMMRNHTAPVQVVNRLAGSIILLLNSKPASLSDLKVDSAKSVCVEQISRFDGVIGLAEIAHSSGSDVISLAKAYVALGDILDLKWLQEVAAAFHSNGFWERATTAGVLNDLKSARLDFIRASSSVCAEQAVHDWAVAHRKELESYSAMAARARESRELTVAMLCHVARCARNLLNTAK